VKPSARSRLLASAWQAFAFLARPAVDGGELIPLLARFQGPAYPFHLAYPLSRYMSNHLRVFIPWATELFGRLA
jgi:LysR family transcriptional regulator for bpeEF and oprC